MKDCIGKHSPWEWCSECRRPDRTTDYLFAGLMALLIVAAFGTVIAWMLLA